MRNATLCILTRRIPDLEVLLAMKKRGFGVGKWNGVGGKVESDETIEVGAQRETFEEISVKITKFHKVAELEFSFTDKPELGQLVHVYMVTVWEGVPQESEEMAPKWFRPEDIPYFQMWDGDQLWWPRVLAGERLKGKFIFEGEKVVGEPEVKLAMI